VTADALRAAAIGLSEFFARTLRDEPFLQPQSEQAAATTEGKLRSWCVNSAHRVRAAPALTPWRRRLRSMYATFVERLQALLCRSDVPGTPRHVGVSAAAR
jgi:hypothetical protein